MTGGDWRSKSGDQGCGCNQSFSRRAIVETQWAMTGRVSTPFLHM